MILALSSGGAELRPEELPLDEEADGWLLPAGPLEGSRQRPLQTTELVGQFVRGCVAGDRNTGVGQR